MTTTNNKSLPLLLLLLITILITLILLFQLQTINQPFSLFSPKKTERTDSPTLSKLRESVTFLPLKDLRFVRSSMEGHTWFMSSINDTQEPNEPLHISFPSDSSKNRVLCFSARDRSDGTKNSYALAYANALPYNATLLKGLTVISDTHYDYSNLWHGLSALVPVVAWHERMNCVKPERWVLFHWGELRVEMGDWVGNVAKSSIGDDVRIENFDNYGEGGVVCFERAVVFRHNEGGLSRERREEVYDMVRCKARRYCNFTWGVEDKRKEIRVLLFLRVGGRAFKNETAVIGVFERECRKVEGCVMKVARPNNLTFCDQVKLMSETDVLISSHGAQLTNMIFMDKNSSLLEFYPKGWLELAGMGQYVYQWMSSWAGMRHQGVWRDQEGDKCPFENNGDCFTFYKDGKIGHNETYFAMWMADVLKEVKEKKMMEASMSSVQEQGKQSACPCD